MLARTGQIFLRRLVVKPQNHHAFSSGRTHRRTRRRHRRRRSRRMEASGSNKALGGPKTRIGLHEPPPPPTKLEEVIKLYKTQLSELKGRGEGLSKRRVKMKEAIEKASGEKKLTMMDQLLELEIEIEDNDKDVEKVGSILESLTAGTSS